MSPNSVAITVLQIRIGKKFHQYIWITNMYIIGAQLTFGSSLIIIGMAISPIFWADLDSGP